MYGPATLMLAACKVEHKPRLKQGSAILSALVLPCTISVPDSKRPRFEPSARNSCKTLLAAKRGATKIGKTLDFCGFRLFLLKVLVGGVAWVFHVHPQLYKSLRTPMIGCRTLSYDVCF